MALYALADLHLALSAKDKPMDIFGPKWEGYHEKIQENWCLKNEDVIVIPGDLSWAMDISEAKEDFAFLAALPGIKIIGKGNHDYWWTSLKKMNAFASEYGNICFLHNNSYRYGDISICGTRGWIRDPDKPEDIKVLKRERIRLEASLSTAEAEPLVFLHYPPIFGALECPEILEVLQKYEVKKCYYGHLHGYSIGGAFQGEKYGIQFSLLSADSCDFTPRLISEKDFSNLSERKSVIR